MKYEENENCLNFMEYYIEKIIELIKDEVTYYIKPELMKSYFEQINNQFNLLLVPLQEALASPNQSVTSNAEAHAICRYLVGYYTSNEHHPLLCF